MEEYDRRLKPASRHLRNHMTDAERVLWRRIRRKQLLGLQFYRQKPLLSFIVDFYCPKAKLVIEFDGSQHYEPEPHARDRERDGRLNALGLRVLRFNDRQYCAR
jgi:very-short-patch-repair endonuclease